MEAAGHPHGCTRQVAAATIKRAFTVTAVAQFHNATISRKKERSRTAKVIYAKKPSRWHESTSVQLQGIDKVVNAKLDHVFYIRSNQLYLTVQ
jgi:hypothetical protein